MTTSRKRGYRLYKLLTVISLFMIERDSCVPGTEEGRSPTYYLGGDNRAEFLPEAGDGREGLHKWRDDRSEREASLEWKRSLGP